MENREQPAFPVNEEITDRIDNGAKIYSGLSKREYFAGLAMQGLLSSPNVGYLTTSDKMIKDSISLADKLLAELSKS